MLRKLARILGIVGGALILLPCLVFIAQSIYTLSLPDTTPLSWESKGYTYGFMMMSIIPAVIAAVGFAGSFFVRKKHVLAGVLMIVCGVMLLIPPAFYISGLVYAMLTDATTASITWLSAIPALLLIFAGILSLLYRPVSGTEGRAVSPSDNAG